MMKTNQQATLSVVSGDRERAVRDGVRGVDRGRHLGRAPSHRRARHRRHRHHTPHTRQSGEQPFVR